MLSEKSATVGGGAGGEGRRGWEGWWKRGCWLPSAAGGGGGAHPGRQAGGREGTELLLEHSPAVTSHEGEGLALGQAGHR